MSKLPQVGASIFSVMSALAHKHNAINLSQGFPNFKSDQKLIDLVSKAMNSGYNQYAPMPGIFSLRKAISKKFEHLYDSTYDPDSEITITAGATQAIFTIISAFVREGDEVVIFKPAYDCYEPAVQLCGGQVQSIQLQAPDYAVDWNQVKQKVTSKTKMVIINTPHNPSGTLLSKQDMLSLQQLLKGTQIVVLSDEVYEHIVFDDEKHQSVCLFDDLKTRSFITASFGKTFHNTGWKIGYCCAPNDLMSEFRKVHQYNVFSVNHPVQVALATYLEAPEHYMEIADLYQKKRDYFLDLISGSRFKFSPSKGTYFQVLDYSEISQEHDVDFAKRLTIEHQLASIPLSVFNDGGLDNKVLRFCFAKTDDTLKQAAEVINKI